MLDLLQIQWQFDESDQGDFVDYDHVVSAKIESAFQAKQPYVDFSEEDEEHKLITIRVDLKKMLEFDVNSPNDSKRVRRNAPGTRAINRHLRQKFKVYFSTFQKLILSLLQPGHQ